MPCCLLLDGVATPPSGKPPGPGHSRGHEKPPGLAAMRLTFVFQQCYGSSRVCVNYRAADCTGKYEPDLKLIRTPTMFKKPIRSLSIVMLTFWGTTVNAAVQSGDFRISEDGGIIFLDGSRGAPVHIQYIGASLRARLKVRIAPNNSNLRVTPSTCSFTRRKKDCRISVYLRDKSKKVFGVNQFTITEIGSIKPLTPIMPENKLPFVFGVGIQESNMPQAIGWYISSDGINSDWPKSGPVILANATTSDRLYKGEDINNYDPITHRNRWTSTHEIYLKKNSICYLDRGSINPPLTQDREAVVVLSKYFPRTLGATFRDITDPSRTIYNGANITGNNNITTCAANGMDDCSSGYWGSMSVGLANLGSSDLINGSYGIRAGEIQVIYSNSYNNSSWNDPGSIIYWRKEWGGSPVALMSIQGSIDGSGFDVIKATPSIEEIRSAAPCSTFIRK
jgi:hypothetical protein